METNLQIIRDACIKANPKIVELEFGCEIAVSNDRGYIHYSMWDKDGPTLLGFVSSSHPKTLRPIQWERGDPLNYTILGRPIRLADVLLAISRLKIAKYEGGKSDPGNICISTDGVFLNENAMHLGVYNFLNDDLTAQSPETLQFLADLLTNK